MQIRVEPFVQGFMTAMKPQLTAQDREFLGLAFQSDVPLTRSTRDEQNPSKAVHYFRFKKSHLNVLLPVWIMNGRKTSKADRFRIAFTDDHSFILDTKEMIIYDPTTEASHAVDDYQPFFLSSDWKNESTALFIDELRAKRLTICTLGERIEHLPAIYDSFVAFVAKHKLKAQVTSLRYGLNVAGVRRETAAQAAKELIITEIALGILAERARSRAA